MCFQRVIKLWSNCSNLSIWEEECVLLEDCGIWRILAELKLWRQAITKEMLGVCIYLSRSKKPKSSYLQHGKEWNMILGLWGKREGWIEKNYQLCHREPVKMKKFQNRRKFVYLLYLFVWITKMCQYLKKSKCQDLKKKLPIPIKFIKKSVIFLLEFKNLLSWNGPEGNFTSKISICWLFRLFQK